jgi:hypothetical protein
LLVASSHVRALSFQETKDVVRSGGGSDGSGGSAETEAAQIAAVKNRLRKKKKKGPTATDLAVERAAVERRRRQQSDLQAEARSQALVATAQAMSALSQRAMAAGHPAPPSLYAEWAAAPPPGPVAPRVNASAAASPILAPASTKEDLAGFLNHFGWGKHLAALTAGGANRPSDLIGLTKDTLLTAPISLPPVVAVALPIRIAALFATRPE